MSSYKSGVSCFQLSGLSSQNACHIRTLVSAVGVGRAVKLPAAGVKGRIGAAKARISAVGKRCGGLLRMRQADCAADAT